MPTVPLTDLRASDKLAAYLEQAHFEGSKTLDGGKNYFTNVNAQYGQLTVTARLPGFYGAQTIAQYPDDKTGKPRTKTALPFEMD